MSVDQAVWNFGSALQSQLHEAEQKAKTDRAKKAARTKVFTKWLPGTKADTAYRDPSTQTNEDLRR